MVNKSQYLSAPIEVLGLRQIMPRDILSSLNIDIFTRFRQLLLKDDLKTIILQEMAISVITPSCLWRVQRLFFVLNSQETILFIRSLANPPVILVPVDK